MPSASTTVPWIRYPTPELVPLVCALPSPLVIYEVVDDHERSPGMSDRLRSVFRAAEDRLLERAGLVFAWSEPIAERLRARHANVVLAPAAADIDAFARARVSVRSADRTVTYAGSLDFRFDARLVAETARVLPDWRFRLAGPADPESRSALAVMPNVELLGRLAPEAVPAFLATGAACLMPYRQNAFNDNLFPIKLIESLASGRPIVSTDIRGVRAFSDVVAVAGDASGIARALRDSADEPPDAAARRIARAVPYGWKRRIDEMQAALEAALP